MKYKACCPVCGWMLMQVKPNAEISYTCHKCGSSLWILVEASGVRVLAKNIEKKAADGSYHPATGT